MLFYQLAWSLFAAKLSSELYVKSLYVKKGVCQEEVTLADENALQMQGICS
jgi:hypothetical protein